MAGRNAVAKEKTVLEEAAACVAPENIEKYGDPVGTMARWRDLCRATDRIGLQNVTSEDLAIAMILLKVARETYVAKRDTCVDIAGYASILNDVREM